MLFFGSPDHLPNQDALAWLATDLWPRISARVADARCVVTGGARSAKLARSPRRGRDREQGASSPTSTSELAAAAVVVAPVRSGRGVRIKNLDTLAAGRPLVTTRLGARGLDLQDAEHAMVADGTSDFSDAVVEVLHDPALAARLGTAGREHVTRTFTHEDAARSNLDLWKMLAAGVACATVKRPLLFPIDEVWWFYAAFVGFITLLLVLDLKVFHKKSHAVTSKEALGWSIFWIAWRSRSTSALYLMLPGVLARNPRVAEVMPGADPSLIATDLSKEFLNGYLVEMALSVDNLFVFIIIFSLLRDPGRRTSTASSSGASSARIILRGALHRGRRGADAVRVGRDR